LYLYRRDKAHHKKRGEASSSITYTVSEKKLDSGNRNPILLLFTAEKVDMEMVWFHIEVNTVVFQHNNRWKGFLHTTYIFRPGPKPKKRSCALIRTTTSGHPGNTFYDSFTVNTSMFGSKVTS